MKKTSKILAGSSISAFLALGGGLTLGLAYSGTLFALLPFLSSIGISTIGPALIGATALFFSISLVLSISFLRSKHLEKKKSKEVRKEYVEINPEELKKEQAKIRNFSKEAKEEYFEEAIKDFDQLAISAIVNEEDAFKEVISMPKYGHLIYYAAKEGGNDVVQYIQTLGVDLNAPSYGNDKYASIYYAITPNETHVLKCLLDNGADPLKILCTDEKGVIRESDRTPLMFAADSLQKENVALLLEIAAVKENIDAVDSDNDTALKFALNNDNEDLSSAQKKAQYYIVKLLLDKGANPTIESNDKEKALDFAERNDCKQSIISLLDKAEKKWEKKHKGKHTDNVAKGKGSQVPHK